jgi:Tfp pilus assembly protein PilX
MTPSGEHSMPHPRVREKRGVALMAVLLVTLAIVAIVIVASTTTLKAR